MAKIYDHDGTPVTMHQETKSGTPQFQAQARRREARLKAYALEKRYPAPGMRPKPKDVLEEETGIKMKRRK